MASDNDFDRKPSTVITERFLKSVMEVQRLGTSTWNAKSKRIAEIRKVLDKLASKEMSDED